MSRPSEIFGIHVQGQTVLEASKLLPFRVRRYSPPVLKLCFPWANGDVIFEDELVLGEELGNVSGITQSNGRLIESKVW